MKHPKFYTIKQTAEKARVSVSTLRRLDERGIFKPRRGTNRGNNNYRMYSTEDIYKLLKLLTWREKRTTWDKRFTKKR